MENGDDKMRKDARIMAEYLNENKSFIFRDNFSITNGKLIPIENGNLSKKEAARKIKMYQPPNNEDEEDEQNAAVFSFGMTLLYKANPALLGVYSDGEILSDINQFNRMDLLLASLIEQCIVITGKKRIKAEIILKHPYFQVNNLDQEIIKKISEINPSYKNNKKPNSKIFLARGGFGMVYVMLKPYKFGTHLSYYVKKVVNLKDLNEEDSKREINEASINKQIRDLKITDCITTFQYNVKENDSLKLYMEYYPGLELAKLLGDYGCLYEEDARSIFYSVARGLERINNADLIYRDLKPNNILVGYNAKTKELEGKLIDFGITIRKGYSLKAGTKQYIAPEANHDNSDQVYYNEAVDIFSFGVSLYQSLIGTNFWAVNSVEKTTDPNVIAQMPQGRGLSQAVINLIEQCIQYEPKNRIASFKDILAHPWFKKDHKDSKEYEEEEYTFRQYTKQSK